jgi:hypothetical protein
MESPIKMCENWHNIRESCGSQVSNVRLVEEHIVIKITVKHNLSYLPWLQGVVINHLFWQHVSAVQAAIIRSTYRACRKKVQWPTYSMGSHCAHNLYYDKMLLKLQVIVKM